MGLPAANSNLRRNIQRKTKFKKISNIEFYLPG